MFSLAFVSFVAGILTILAPCVLPVLPVILAGSLSEKGKWYPYIITASLAVSIVLFTIILKASTLFIMVPPSFWTTFSSVILILLGLTYVFPHIWSRITTFLHFDRSSQTLDTTQNIESSTLRAIVTGAALGPVFSSCSPTYSLLLATVFPVSFLAGIGYTILYALGLAWMLLIIARGGRTVITKLRIFADERGYFRKSLGVLLILIGLFIVSGYEQKVESALLARYNVNSTEQSILDRFIPPLVRRNMAPTSQTVNLPVSHSGTKIAPPFPLSITNPFRAPELTGLTDWINSDPLTLEQLK